MYSDSGVSLIIFCEYSRREETGVALTYIAMAMMLRTTISTFCENPFMFGGGKMGGPVLCSSKFNIGRQESLLGRRI